MLGFLILMWMSIAYSIKVPVVLIIVRTIAFEVYL